MSNVFALMEPDLLSQPLREEVCIDRSFESSPSMRRGSVASGRHYFGWHQNSKRATGDSERVVV
eukprot:6300687-Amphidinium_carterae.1